MRFRKLAPALLVVAPLATLLTPHGVQTIDAAPKGAKAGAPACGVTALPLVVGNQWTYSFVPAPLPAPPDIARIAPPTPKGFVIAVKDIQTKDGDTVVSLEEKLTYDFTKDPKKPNVEERVVNTTITCNAKKFDVSPDSFFFAGEPGGYQGMTINSIERKGTSYVFAKSGNFGDAPWPEDIKAKWAKKPFEKSGAKDASGTIEIERRFTPQEPETVATKSMAYPKAEKIAIAITGRITLDKPLSADLKPAELPANWLNTMWFAPGTGVIQSLNSYAHMYQLVDSQLK